MARPSVELLFILGYVSGCSGITQRTVAEAGAASGASSGGSPASGVGGANGGGAGGNGAGGNGAGGNGAGGNGAGGQLVVCDGGPNPVAVRALSTWEYGRSVVALTGAPVSGTLPADPQLDAPFAFSMDVSGVTTELLFAEAEKQGTAARDGKLLPCDVAKPVDGECSTKLVEQVVGRAFRRPLLDAELARYVSLFELGSAQGDVANGVALVVEASLISPLFLHKVYLGSGGGSGRSQLTGYELASRLSYFLAGAPPDATLSAAAADGDLLTEEGVGAEALRLLDLPTFIDAAQHFHSQWLGLDRLQHVQTAGATPELLASMRIETEHFIAAVFQGTRRLPDLLTSNMGFIDRQLAPIYGLAVPAKDFDAVQLDPLRYFGLLTLPSTLTQFSNPTQRGLFVRQRLLCGAVPPPPPSIDTTIDISPTETRRMAWQQHRTNPMCGGCHLLMDPIGFGLENWDALGRFRVTDNGLPVDASGELTQTGDDQLEGNFVGAGELAGRLSDSAVVDQCVAKTWLGYALQRPTAEGDDCAVQRALATFSPGRDIGELCVALAKSDQFRSREGYDVPNVPPPGSLSGPIDTLLARRKLLLDFSLSETMWLGQVVPQEDRPVFERYAAALRELQIKLTQSP